MKAVTTNVFVNFGTRGANVGLIKTSEGLVMVESHMLPDDAYKFREEVAKIGKIKYLINTEPHMDHVAGDYYFEGIVVGHEGTRQTVLNSSINQVLGMLGAFSPDTKLEKGYCLRPPTLTFSQRLTLHMGDLSINLIHLPGHTASETAVYIPQEKVIFTGDNVVNGTMPFLHEADPYKWIESLNQMDKMDISYIVPGHGEVQEKSYLKVMSSQISVWIEAVKNAANKGWTLEEAQAGIDLTEQYPGDKKRMLTIQKNNIAHLYEFFKAQH